MPEKQIDTGGGAYIGGGVEISGGDFVGRDKVVEGDEVHGDKVQGDSITVGDIKGSTGIAIGRGAQASVSSGLSAYELAELFSAVYRQIEIRPEDPEVDKEELVDTVKMIELEAAKGEDANPRKVERWMRFLGGMAPDIMEVAAATLANPVAGVASVIRKVAEKAMSET